MSNSKKNQPSSTDQTWKSLIIWAVLALFLRWQILEPRWIPSGSMLPTLQLQDRILVEKIRPKIQKSIHNQIHYQDLVIFSPPQVLVDAGYDKNAALIKRVVGLPQDHIEVHDGNLFRNKVLVEEEWLKEPIKYTMSEITVPDNSLWVLGDNRNNSLDSHIWGALPDNNLIGTAFWRYWPLNKSGPIRFPLQKKI